VLNGKGSSERWLERKLALAAARLTGTGDLKLAPAAKAFKPMANFL
jgi:hypothetical protein